MESMSRDVASLIVRLEHRLTEATPGLPYEHETQEQLDLDDRIIREAVDIIRSDPNLSRAERDAVRMLLFEGEEGGAE